MGDKLSLDDFYPDLTPPDGLTLEDLVPAANVIADWADGEGGPGDIYALNAACAVFRLVSEAIAKKSDAKKAGEALA